MTRTCSLVAAVVFTCGLATAQASGTYTIDPNGSGPRVFNTFAAAVQSFATSGVSGPVLVNVMPGTYVESVVVPPLTGVSATNTITFRALVGNVLLQGSTGDTFSFTGPGAAPNSGWVVFDGLTFDKAPGFAIFAGNRVEGIEIVHCTFNPEHRPTRSESRDALIVKDATASGEAGWKVHHNKMTLPARTNRSSYGIYMQNVGGWEIHHNVVDMNGATYGLYMINNNRTLDRVYDNLFHGALYATTSTSPINAAVIRADISNYDNDFVHNTFAITVPGASGCAIASGGLGGTSPALNRIHGNVFLIIGPGTAIVQDTATSGPDPLVSDGNLFQVPLGEIGRLESSNGTPFTTLAGWQGAMTPPVDTNSIAADPQLGSITPPVDLRPAATSPVRDAAVMTPSYVGDDFRGRARDGKPDIGAYELSGFGTFAAGCAPGSSSAVPAIGSTGAVAFPSPAFTVTLSSAPGSSPAFLLAGTSRTVFLGVPLPYPLGGGCDVLVGPLIVVGTSTSAGGTASFPLPIPNDPTLVGLDLLLQWLVQTPQAPNAFGIVSSNGGSLNL